MEKYTCARCGETYEKGRSDEEAAKEYADNFPEVPDNQPKAVICDDCYQEFKEWNDKENELLKEVMADIKLADSDPDPNWSKEELEKWIYTKLKVEVRRDIFSQLMYGKQLESNQ